jgi:excisionase family DNA binding protein
MVRERIRHFFLNPSPYYTITTAARLLGVTVAALRREAESDRAEEYRSGRRWRFSWRQAAYIAFRTWTLAEIYDALGNDAAKVLPPLLALRTFSVTLPEFVIRAMETAATDDGATLDAWLHREMMDFASTAIERMEPILPGYRLAFLYPGKSPAS